MGLILSQREKLRHLSAAVIFPAFLFLSFPFSYFCTSFFTLFFSLVFFLLLCRLVIEVVEGKKRADEVHPGSTQLNKKILYFE